MPLNLLPRRWWSSLSPFRWLEAWMDRLERRQKEMLADSERLGLKIAASHAQVTELRQEIERLQARAAEMQAARDEVPPLLLPTSPAPAATGRRCPRGHTAPAAARFCPECGHVFPTRSSGG